MDRRHHAMFWERSPLTWGVAFRVALAVIAISLALAAAGG